MPAVMDDAYERLTKRFPLRPIRDEETNERAFAICDELTDRLDELSLGERDYLEVLSDLVAKFESQWDDDVSKMTPREVVQFLMEQNDLAQKDLIPEFGSASRVSEFLNGQRGLSLEQIRRLAERFNINVSLLMEKPKREPDQAALRWRKLFNEQRKVTYRAFLDAFVLSLDRYEKDWDKVLSEEVDGNLSQVTPKIFAAFSEWVAGQSEPEPVALWYRPHLAHDFAPQTHLHSDLFTGVVDVVAQPKPQPQPSRGFFSRKLWGREENKPKRALPDDSMVEPCSKDMPARRTYRDAVRMIFKLAECDFQRQPDFWQRHVDLDKGDKAIQEFAKELAKELSEW